MVIKSSKKLRAQGSLRNNFKNKSCEILMEKMVKFLNQDTVMIDLLPWCVGQNINPVETYIIDRGKVPTIISA